MADPRDRDSLRAGEGRGRSSSIFSDDDDGRRRGAAGEGDRGFFERAGDEVRSWFGDDEAERRREGEMRSNSAFGRDAGTGAAGGTRSAYGGRGAGDFGGEHYRPERSGDGSGGSDYRGGAATGREQSGTSHFDENYRRWREQQIAAMDREYEEYCRERQHRFDEDFHSWRASRKSQGSGGAPSAPDAPGPDLAGEATAGGGGEGSAMESSTGSSPPPAPNDDDKGIRRR